MKKEAKHNIKKHILSVLSVAVITVLVILLIVVTRKPEEAVAGITINGKTYSEDKPFTILEILPDTKMDEIGCIVGDESGIVKWSELTKGQTSLATGSQESKNIDSYINFVNSFFKGTNYKIMFEYNGQAYADSNLALGGNSWNPIDATKANLYLYETKDNGTTYSAVTYESNIDGETKKTEKKVRNVFSFFVFGNPVMENYVKVEIKTPQNIKKKDIDNADLVYISSTLHDTALANLRNKLDGKPENAKQGSVYWSLGGCDLDAETALYLYMQNASNAKPVIYNSSDMFRNSRESYSNIAKVCLTISGIDRNRFVADFAYKEGDVSKRYSGNFGYIKIEDNTFNLYTNDDKKRTYEANDKEDGINGIAQGNGPFVYWNTYKDYLKNDEGYTSEEIGRMMYQSTDEKRQSHIDKYSWSFKSDNSFTHDLVNSNITPSDADVRDKNYGTTYGEAQKLTKDNDIVTKDLSGAKAIQYIIGAYKKAPASLNVLEIQPIGVYSYDTAEKAKKIRTWFGLSADDTSVTVNVTSLSANGVNGLNEDFLATYDLIILGAQGSGSINNTKADYRTDKNKTGTGDYTIFGKLYNKGNSIHEDIIRSVTISEKGNYHRTEAGYYNSFKLNGNDLTDKVYNQILDYAKKGLPIAMEKDIFYGNTDLVDTDTNVFKCNINKVAKELYSTGYSNIVSINSNGSTSDILNYYVKPKVSIIPKYTDAEDVSHAIVNYKYNESSNSGELNPRSALETLYFNGDVTANSGFTVNVYLDIDCDSVFTDEEKYYSKTGSGSLSNFTLDNPIKTVPVNIPGYVMYKVEIIDNNGLRENYISSFAIDPGTNKRTVKVLQIIPDRNDKSKLTLDLESEEGLFRTLFSDVENITGLRLSVDVVDKEQFSNGIHNNTIDLDLYSMIVLGFQDNYGRENNDKLTDEAVNAIKQFIAQDKSVLMTHDSMSYMKTEWENYDKDKNKYLNQVAGEESEANSITRLLRTAIGMKSTYQFTDVLSYTRLKITPFSWYKSPTTSTTDGINSKTKTTNKISQLNSGEITSYPYAITNEMASEISVAKTHAQYFPLDLTLGSTRTSDVVVWYTLSDPDVTQDMYDNKEYNSDGSDSTKTKAASDYKDYVTVYPRDSSSGSVDKANSAKGYYGYFGQDAVNNYYIYSYGNVTYSSAGHSDMNGAGNEAEMKLFVNTFTRAILAGTVIPDVSYEEAVIDESVTDHKEYVKYNYADYVDSKLTVKFKIDDANYVSGASDVNTFIYLYDADNGPEDGLYKSGSSYCTFLGYLDLESTKEKINYANIKGNAPSANSILSGEVYVIDNLWDYITDPDLQDKIINGKLKIGIQATNKYGKGYALLLNQSRKIFNLD